jgi:sugar lactone lactonase YvrE
MEIINAEISTLDKRTKQRHDSKFFRPSISLETISSNIYRVLLGGTGTTGNGGDGGSATAALVRANQPWVDSSGNIYFCDDISRRIRKISSSGTMLFVGGTGASSTAGASAAIASVLWYQPYAVVGDSGRTFLYISDQNYVWKYSFASNIISVFAHSIGASAGCTGDGGQVSSATLKTPRGLWLTTSGDLYIADSGNNRIRKVSSPSNIITTVAGSGCGQAGGFGGDSTPATVALLNNPRGVYLDSTGRLFIADTSNFRIRVVELNSIITTFAGTGTASPFNGDFLPALSSNINSPYDVKGDSVGNIYISDNGNCAIRIVEPDTGIMSIFFGSLSCGIFASSTGLAPRLSRINNPYGMCLDTYGNLYFTDYATIYKSTTMATSPSFQPSISPNLFMRLVAGKINTGYSGDGGQATSAEMIIRMPFVDNNGNIYAPDSTFYRIRKITTDGIINSFIGTGTTSTSGTSDSPGSVNLRYPFSIVGNAGGTVFYISDSLFIWKYTVGTGMVSVFAHTGGANFGGDGGQAAAAQLNNPLGIWLTTDSVLYIGDSNNNRIRKVASDGIISTVCGTVSGTFSGDGSAANLASINHPTGCFMDTNGNLFIADTGNNRIRRITGSNNIINTLAGSGISNPYNGNNIPATSANINNPWDVKGDTTGNIYVAENGNCIVRMIEAGGNGLLSIIFGSPGACGFSSGISPPTSPLKSIQGIWIDSVSTIYISDFNTIHRSILVASPSSSPSGQPSKAPSCWPSSIPTRMPAFPSGLPSGQPSNQPSVIPSSLPTNPTAAPSSVPSDRPSSRPSDRPSVQPSNRPSRNPSGQPSVIPSSLPTNPTAAPSSVPSDRPSSRPSDRPSVQPSNRPSRNPSGQPSVIPSSLPTNPTAAPSSVPSDRPSSRPSDRPSVNPSCAEAAFPSVSPLLFPCDPVSLRQPSSFPTLYGFPVPYPTPQPSLTRLPIIRLSEFPAVQPITELSSNPSTPLSLSSSHPTSVPTTEDMFSAPPTDLPTIHKIASDLPNIELVLQPTSHLIQLPTDAPAIDSTPIPSLVPTLNSSLTATTKPSSSPIMEPFSDPTNQSTSALSPTSSPSGFLEFSYGPASVHSFSPSIRPSSPSTSYTSEISKSPSFTTRPHLPVFSVIVPSDLDSSGAFRQSNFLFGLNQPSNSHRDIKLSSVGTVAVNYVLLGSKFLPSVLDISVSTSPALISFALSFSSVVPDKLGSRSIAFATDFNSDRRPELLIGDPSSSKIYVIYSDRNNPDWRNITEDFIFTGDSLSAGLGWAISSAGDYNGDGTDDLIVSAIYSNKCYLLMGKRMSNTFSSINIEEYLASHQLNGISISANIDPSTTVFGVAIASAGDFNGDNFTDVAVSALGGSGLSKIYIILSQGKSFASSIVVNQPFRNGLIIEIHAPIYSFAGLSLAGMKDVNGDGIGDLLIGSIPYNKGYVTQLSYLVYGNRSTSFVISLSSLVEEHRGCIIKGGGFIVSSIGDINNDGLDDMMITNYINWQGKPGSYLVNYPAKQKWISNTPSQLPSSSPTFTSSSCIPSVSPSILNPPSNFPTFINSLSAIPSFTNDTLAPTFQKPTRMPITCVPSRSPTFLPSKKPSVSPIRILTSPPFFSFRPTILPSIPKKPSMKPSRALFPSSFPSSSPSLSAASQGKTVILTDTGEYQGENGAAEIVISSQVNLHIKGNQGKKHYIIPPSIRNNITITIVDFKISSEGEEGDILDFSQLSPSFAYFYSTEPLIFHLLSPYYVNIILSSHSSYDLLSENILFPLSFSASSQSSSSSTSTTTQFTFTRKMIALIVVIFTVWLVTFFTVRRFRKRAGKLRGKLNTLAEVDVDVVVKFDDINRQKSKGSPENPTLNQIDDDLSPSLGSSFLSAFSEHVNTVELSLQQSETLSLQLFDNESGRILSEESSVFSSSLHSSRFFYSDIEEQLSEEYNE